METPDPGFGALKRVVLVPRAFVRSQRRPGVATTTDGNLILFLLTHPSALNPKALEFAPSHLYEVPEAPGGGALKP